MRSKRGGTPPRRQSPLAKRTGLTAAWEAHGRHEPCDCNADRLVVVFRARYFQPEETVEPSIVKMGGHPLASFLAQLQIERQRPQTANAPAKGRSQ